RTGSPTRSRTPAPPCSAGSPRPPGSRWSPRVRTPNRGRGSRSSHWGSGHDQGAAMTSTVTEQPLDITAHERAVARPAAGAVVSFAGVVRDHDGGRTVVE